MNQDPSYDFLLLALPVEEITPEMKDAYTWKYVVEYLDESEDLEKPEVSRVDYFSISPDRFEEVEERWYYDFKYNDAEILAINLVYPPAYQA